MFLNIFQGMLQSKIVGEIYETFPILLIGERISRIRVHSRNRKGFLGDVILEKKNNNGEIKLIARKERSQI